MKKESPFSLKLLLDEDSQAKRLIELLRNAGHDIITVSEAGLERKPDSFVLDYARQERRVLLTRNCDDFHTLHQSNNDHYGILAVYQYAVPSPNMSYDTIVNCITNLEAAELSLINQFIALNSWNY